MQKRAVFPIVAALLTTLVLLLVLFFWDGDNTPSVYLPHTDSQGNEAMHGQPPALGIEITADNVQTVIATLTRADFYMREIRQTRYWDFGESYGVHTAEIWVTPELMRIRWDHGENMVITADTYHLWFGNGPVLTRPVTAGLGASLDQILDEFQGIHSYETTLNLDPAQIISAGYTQRNVGGEMRYTIYLAVQLSPQGHIDYYYICTTSGLLLEMATFDGEIPIYRMETISLTLTPPSAGDFLLPDGRTPQSR